MQEKVQWKKVRIRGNWMKRRQHWKKVERPCGVIHNVIYNCWVDTRFPITFPISAGERRRRGHVVIGVINELFHVQDSSRVSYSVIGFVYLLVDLGWMSWENQAFVHAVLKLSLGIAPKREVYKERSQVCRKFGWRKDSIRPITITFVGKKPGVVVVVQSGSNLSGCIVRLVLLFLQ